MDEEVGRVAGHGGVGLHAVVVDAPALAGGVARPGELDRAREVGAVRKRPMIGSDTALTSEICGVMR
jgi:hypothetical protein